MNKILANLSIRQRITIAVVLLAASAGVYGVVHYQKEADFRPLFTGVAPEDAASIVQKLKESGVEYRLPEGGGSVLVPSAKIAETRIAMAADGLPKTGRIGFELFDKANLGATEFTEQVNYRRALEGELERSVMALEEVEQARVHLTFPKDSVFVESQEPAKASVLVKLRPNTRLAPQNVLAIDHLVASAVEGLSPDAVSVLDMNGNLLGQPKTPGGLDGPEPSEAALEYRHRVEADLLAKINSTLEPLLGANRFRAGVSVDCDFTGGEQSEEIFDPARTVMTSSQRTEDSTGGGSSGGVPGTASTLPKPTSRPASSSNRTSRLTENIAYQSSRTVTKTRMPAGLVKKISLAVLVDQTVDWQKDQKGFRRVLVPPTPEAMKIIHDLVAGVTGFSQERGDQLVIESLPFESTLLLEPPEPAGAPGTAKPAAPAVWGIQLDRKTLTMVGAAAGGAIVLTFVLMVLMRRTPAARVEVTGPAELPGGNTAATARASLSAAKTEKDLEEQLAERDALQQKMDAQTLSSLKLAPVITKKAEVLAKHLREKISKEPEVSAQVLRTWIRERKSPDELPGARPMILNTTKQEEAITGLRKAAMLLIVLGEQSSAELLQQLSEEDVQKVSREVAKLTAISGEQAETILNEFHHITTAGDYVARGGFDFARKLLLRAFNPETAKRLLDRLTKALGSEAASFDAIQKADPGQLAKFIHNEHPQTIALVLSHLNSTQAAALLTSLPAGLRSDVAQRMASLDQISPEVIFKIAGVIGQKLKALGEFSRESYGGVRAVAEILNRLDSTAGREILTHIDQQDTNLAETIRHLMFVFEDLLLIDPLGLKEVLGKVDRKVLTIALKGTSEQLRNQILSSMSQRGADMLREDMEALGPIKIKEVEAAQQQIIAVVRQLESEGVLNLKGTVGEQYVV